jgi:hypothetical protein
VKFAAPPNAEPGRAGARMVPRPARAPWPIPKSKCLIGLFGRCAHHAQILHYRFASSLRLGVFAPLRLFRPHLQRQDAGFEIKVPHWLAPGRCINTSPAPTLPLRAFSLSRKFRGLCRVAGSSIHST